MLEWKQYLNEHRPPNVHPTTFDGAACFLARVQHFSPGLVELDGALFVTETGFTPMFKKAIAKRGLPETPYLLKVATTKALPCAGKKAQLNATQAFVATDAVPSAVRAPKARVRRPAPGPFNAPRTKRMHTIYRTPTPSVSAEDVPPLPTVVVKEKPKIGCRSTSSDEIIFIQETREAGKTKAVPARVEQDDGGGGKLSEPSDDESDGIIMDIELTPLEQLDDDDAGVHVDPVTGRVAVFQAQTDASSAPGPDPLELQVEARLHSGPICRPLPVLHGGGLRVQALSEDVVEDF